MSNRLNKPAVRVQVYFENSKLETALRREARATKVPLSRAAERAIERGLLRRPQADPEDRLLMLDRALRDHMRAQQRDMAIVQEILVEFARAFFARLPDTPADHDPLMTAAVEARIERMLDAAAFRLQNLGRRAAPAEAPGETAPLAESRTFQAAE
jgi:hypothetical protein